MNKYPLVTPKAKQATWLILTCVIAALCSWAVYLFCLNFSSPSSAMAVSNQSTAIVMSTMDLQRELNRRDPKLKLKVDGVYGPLTREAHERAVGDQYAKELMVWEVK